MKNLTFGKKILKFKGIKGKEKRKKNEKKQRRYNKDGVFGYKENRGLEKIRGNR
jgi:hypothetical protein